MVESKQVCKLQLAVADALSLLDVQNASVITLEHRQCSGFVPALKHANPAAESNTSCKTASLPLPFVMRPDTRWLPAPACL